MFKRLIVIAALAVPVVSACSSSVAPAAPAPCRGRSDYVADGHAVGLRPRARPAVARDPRQVRGRVRPDGWALCAIRPHLLGRGLLIGVYRSRSDGR